MGWGTRIIVAYAAGVCFILYFVIRSMMLNTEMAEEDYYSKELAYNAHIEAVDNAKKMAQPITIQANAAQILIVMDSITSLGMMKGMVHFYNPASEKADQKINLPASADGKYFFPKNHFVKGKYFVRLSFEYKQKPYFTEQVIYIE